ncbi:hypothetical protein P6144_11235 [Sphingomonas sp. HITSZ_GF]|uniref:glycosyltransferase n=1 Tax=Sphingomonas sp. HITSZ_GF TaxID=3037247 RepID=UPI00240D4303|nr:nucleotide disphospho-sugar-binding domain-containing protein [Sphingomonas sp. HITSZ_GF]MDG2534225.1 hypothetical protein [Sphingomonas sp. HITSZ_GF]
MHLLATWELGLGYGHVATLAPIGRVLRRAGHRLTLAARTPETALRIERDAFDAVLQAPRHIGPATGGETLTYGQVIAAGGMGHAAAAIPLVAQWLALFERRNPDALIAEHAPISILAAHVAGLPAVRLGPTFVAPPARHVGTSLLPWAGHGRAELAQAQRPADLVVRTVCRHFGAPMLAGLGELLEGAPGHALAWSELDHYGPGAADFYYGPLVGIAADARPEWPAGEGPRTLVYLPFDRASGVAVAQALGALGWPALWHAAGAPPEDLPANIRFSAAPIDLDAVAREAALYVGRGGYGASARMLGAGVPQLLLPDTLESLLLTYRLRLAGVAQSQAASAGPDAVRDALRRIAGSDALRLHAGQVAARHVDHSPADMADLLGHDLIRAVTR